MAERAPLLPEVTSDVASISPSRHVEADEDGQWDASRARTRGRVRAAIAATGLMALVGAAATRASRPDAGGFFAPSSFPGARLGARGAPRGADAGAPARPARLTDRIGASDTQHPNNPQQPQRHFRAPTATIDGIDETRWRPEEIPVVHTPRGAPNEWGSAVDELPWWAQPGAANAIAFPDSYEAEALDRHLAGEEDRVQGDRDRESHADTARLGDKANEGMLQLSAEEAAERSERVAARIRRRQHAREVRAARAQAETESNADASDAEAETKTKTKTETETTPGRTTRATAAGDDATRANRREEVTARRVGEEAGTTSAGTSAGTATTRRAAGRDAGPNAAGMARAGAEAESRVRGKVNQQRQNAAKPGAAEAGAAELGGAKEEARKVPAAKPGAAKAGAATPNADRTAATTSNAAEPAAAKPNAAKPAAVEPSVAQPAAATPKSATPASATPSAAEVGAEPTGPSELAFKRAVRAAKTEVAASNAEASRRLRAAARRGDDDDDRRRVPPAAELGARPVPAAAASAAPAFASRASDRPEPLRFAFNPSDEDRKAGYLPLDVKRTLPLNPFSELLPQQHGDVAGAYARIGWEQMRAEGELRLAESRPNPEPEPEPARSAPESEAPGAETRPEKPPVVVAPKVDHGGRGQLGDGEALAAIRQRENARRERIASREAKEARDRRAREAATRGEAAELGAAPATTTEAARVEAKARRDGASD